jgi:hypothetical protein
LTLEMKARVRKLAELEGANESALIRRLLNGALGASTPTVEDPPSRVLERRNRQVRLYVRVTAEDMRLLRERAAARGMAPATYVALVVRSHLSGGAPLPKAEYLALRQSVLELSAIGRSLNQVAKAINQNRSVSLPGRAEVAVMLRIAEGLRDHVWSLLKANEASWSRRAQSSC